MATTQRTLRLEFPKRPRVKVTKYDFRNRTWTSKCGLYRLVHCHCLLGQEANLDGGLPDVWLALAYHEDGGWWELISRNRKRGPAERACEKHQRRS